MLPIKPVDAPLYVVTPIINPQRFRSRYHLYREFSKYITDAGAKLYTVEVAYGDREFEISTEDHPNHIQLRTKHELWHKENMINIGVSRLPSDWKYVAWIDADVTFARKDIVEETVHQLQHYSFVQMFSHALDLGPKHEPLGMFQSFGSQWMKNLGHDVSMHQNYAAGTTIPGYRSNAELPGYSRTEWHPGYAWACTREAWDHVGGLLDHAIVGSGDRYMAAGLVGEMGTVLSNDIGNNCPTYTQMCFEWQERAERHIKRNIGVVDGLLTHAWHGSKKDRGYFNRSEILWKNGFDPSKDIKRDWQGLWQLSDQKIALRDQLRAYFSSRKEDRNVI